MRVSRLKPLFVEEIPADLTSGVLYVSIGFRTTMHLCCCGCSSIVVLPIRPSAWRVTYDGDSVSMSPSVGNWSFPCRSHYWIRDGDIEWAPEWSDEQITHGRRSTLTERRGPDASEPLAPMRARPWGRFRAWLRALCTTTE
jgi:hypothetical protein